MEQLEGCYGCWSLARRITEADATIAALQARVQVLEAEVDTLTQQEESWESQLTQRTAELEALRPLYDDMWKQFAESQAELERVRGELVEATHNVNVYQSLYSTSCMDRALLENDLRDIRTLVLALPKGEGDWTVSCALADRVVEGGIVSDISEAVAAIVQHRQGMEG